MRTASYLFAIAAAALFGGGVWWAVGTEAVSRVTGIDSTDGQRFNTVFPSTHETLAACVACHRVDATTPERWAPSLVGIVGAEKARSPWFGYSVALAEAEGVWSKDALDAYLADPVGELPGTIKTLAPIRDEAERRRIIDALETPGDG